MEQKIAKYEILSEKENKIFETKLWALFERRSKLYLMDDSSSMTNEDAEEIFKSVCYVFQSYLDFYSIGKKEILDEDFDIIYDKAIKLIENKIELCKRLYLQAENDKPQVESRSMNDTLNSIGKAFKMYDYRHFAHIFPDDIDYQLALNIDEEKYVGIDYRIEYLKRLQSENLFINKFDFLRCHNLLGANCIDYTGLLVNLFEPVFANALALESLKTDIFALKLTKNDMEELFALIHYSNGDFDYLVDSVALKLNITIAYQIKYLKEVADNISTQCKMFSSAKELRSIFTCF